MDYRWEDCSWCYTVLAAAGAGASGRRRAAGADRPEFRKFGDYNAEIEGLGPEVVTASGKKSYQGRAWSSDWASGVATGSEEERRESRTG